MKVQDVFFLVAIFSVAYIQLVEVQSLQGCKTSCGNVTFEYPFGTSPGYYYAEDPGFNLTCNETNQKLFFLNAHDLYNEIEVTSISNDGQMHIMVPMSYPCYNSTGNLTDGSEIPCRFKNPFQLFDDPNSVYNASCTYGILVEDGNINETEFPMVLDWSIGNQICEQVGNRSICAANSECSDSSHGTGYLCICKRGYKGNAYLSNGCLLKAFEWTPVILGTTIACLVLLFSFVVFLLVRCLNRELDNMSLLRNPNGGYYDQNGDYVFRNPLAGMFGRPTRS